jgi:hypothetical protein
MYARKRTTSFTIRWSPFELFATFLSAPSHGWESEFYYSIIKPAR